MNTIKRQKELCRPERPEHISFGENTFFNYPFSLTDTSHRRPLFKRQNIFGYRQMPGQTSNRLLYRIFSLKCAKKRKENFNNSLTDCQFFFFFTMFVCLFAFIFIFRNTYEASKFKNKNILAVRKEKFTHKQKSDV